MRYEWMEDANCIYCDKDGWELDGWDGMVGNREVMILFDLYYGNRIGITRIELI